MARAHTVRVIMCRHRPNNPTEPVSVCTLTIKRMHCNPPPIPEAALQSIFLTCGFYWANNRESNGDDNRVVGVARAQFDSHIKAHASPNEFKVSSETSLCRL